MNFGDLMDSTVVLEKDYGSAGLELKELVKANETRTFVIPFGAFNKGQDDDNGNYSSANLYTGKDCPAYSSGQLWMSVQDLNDTFKEVAGISEKQTVTTRLFITPPAKATWYHDLGYVSTGVEERELRANGLINDESWQRVVRNTKMNLYPGNAVMPQAWHNLPLIEVMIDDVGGEKVYTPITLVWLKLKPQQFDNFRSTFAGLKTAPDPSIQWKVIEIHNSGEGMDRYSFTRLEYMELPESQREEFSGYREEVETAAQTFFTNLVKNQHGGDVTSDDNVRNYLLSITTFKKWDEFVAANNIRTRPVDGNTVEKVSSLRIDFE